MIPEEVFHYTRRNVAIEKILYNKKIRLGQLGFTNDPKETKTRLYLFNRKDSSGRLDKLFFEVSNKNKEIIDKEWKVFCVVKNHPDYKETSPSFHSGACRPRMWATYGENHQGICLRFDGEKLNERIRKELSEETKIFSDSVVYDDDKALSYNKINYEEVEKIGTEEFVRRYFLENWKEEFFVKTKDWETEYEYRWLVHNFEDQPIDISIEKVLTGIILGADFQYVYLPVIKKLCLDLEVPLETISWQNGNPIVNHFDIDDIKSM